jgi:flagellar protein FlaJ
MTSFRFFLKLKGKAPSKGADSSASSSSTRKFSFNKDLLKGDLFCHLTYMSAIATSKLPRNLLFEYAATLPYNSTRYIRKVHFLAKKLNYDYSEACRIVGEETQEAEPKAILLRMANALSSGENESDFLAREAFALGETYGDEYERSIESLKKWTDAFVALILSSSLVVVISVVSMLIFPMNPTYITLLTWLMLMSTLLGAWIMYRASPKDIKTHSLNHTSPYQKFGRDMFKYMVLPLGVIMLFLMLAVKPDLGWGMIVVAIIVLPTGLLMMLDDRRIDQFDSDIAGFLRSLGGVTRAIGTTITEGLQRIDFRALGSLKKPAITLNSALLLGIKPELCWQRFVGGTGSEHVNRSVQIFWDGIAVGGNAEKVGNQSSMFAMKIALLRAKRKLVSSNFTFTTIIIHATIAVLLVGIYQVLVNFTKLLGNMGDMEPGTIDAIANMPTFQFLSTGSSSLDLLHMMVTIMLVVMTVVNAAAIKVVDGGNNLKFLFYLGILLAISGLSLLLVPDILKGVFGAIEIVP